MADSSSLLQEQPENHSCPAKLPVPDIPKRDFSLTEAQRTFIQHHLPRTFVLLPVSANCSRFISNSKALIEDSLIFIQRRRGRPEGSSKKTSKAARERKSARIALISRPSYTSLQRSSLSERSSNEEEADRISDFEHQEVPLEKSQEQEAVSHCRQPSREEQVNDNCKEIQAKNALQSKSIEAKLEGDKPCTEEDKTSQIINKKAEKKNTSNKKTLKKKASKKQHEVSDAALQGDLLETPLRKEGDHQTQLKTQPSNKQFAPTFEQSPLFEAERTILRRLKAHRQIFPFLEPVDEVRDGAPNYYKEILTPIDLQTIQFKLTTGIYKEAAEFHSDIRLMWANSKTYNRRNNFMQKITEELENYYLNLLSRPKSGRKKKA